MEELLHHVFHEYGLIGTLLIFLMIGPGFTYVRTRGMQAQVEHRAQMILNEFLREEREHAESLERQLLETHNRLDTAKEDLFALRMKLAETKLQMEELPELREQIQQLKKRVADLESQVSGYAEENDRLRQQNMQQKAQIQQLEEALAQFRENMQPTEVSE